MKFSSLSFPALISLVGALAPLHASDDPAPMARYDFSAAGSDLRVPSGGAAPELVPYRSEGFDRDVAFVPGRAGGAALKTTPTWLGLGKRSGGAGLKTASPITLPASGAVDFLVRPESIDDLGQALAGLSEVGSRPTRWRFFSNGGEGSGRAEATFGDLPPMEIIGPAVGVDYRARTWYYVALSWEIRDGIAEVNAWVADLDTGSSQPVQTVKNFVSRHAGGMETILHFGSINESDRFFHGQLQDVTFFDRTLDEGTVARRAARAAGG